MTRRACLTVLAVVAFLTAQAVPALAADTPLSSATSASDVTAFGGTAAWSEAIDPASSSPRYRLAVRRRGRNLDLDLKSFTHPVVADLGPGRRRGSVVAVYTRCVGKETGDCDLYRLDVLNGTERKLGLSRPGIREFAASAWRGRYLFASERFEDDRGDDVGLFKTAPTRRIDPRVPGDTDLRGTRAAYQLGELEPFDNRIVLQRFRRRRAGPRCLVARGFLRPRADEFVLAVSPVLSRRFVYWLELGDSGRPVRVARRRLRRGCRLGPVARSTRRIPADTLAVGAGRFYYAGDTSTPGTFRTQLRFRR